MFGAQKHLVFTHIFGAELTLNAANTQVCRDALANIQFFPAPHPLTLHREDGELTMETIVFDYQDRECLATLKAEVTKTKTFFVIRGWMSC